MTNFLLDIADVHNTMAYFFIEVINMDSIGLVKQESLLVANSFDNLMETNNQIECMTL